ncbi:MAG TPA: PDZ domain-containing protein [Gemmatimonadaceae bacterium]|nr:PDZ domain-containing protein [Gemmatimonadaceae bacterium]
MRLRVSILAAAISIGTVIAEAQQPQAAVTLSAPVTEVSYTVRYDRDAATEGAVKMAMRFTTAGDAPVILSLPAWTPGAYELTYFARWVQNFAASSGDGRPLEWDKVDYDTWRVRPNGATSVTVTFDFVGDSLDNAMTWRRPDFLMLNGTNVFLYPEGHDPDWPATVQVQTEPAWRVATGMNERATRVFTAPNYHDLVDMPFFIGAFDLDSSRISESWVRLATYPAGGVAGAERQTIWNTLRRTIPPQVKVFGETPWQTYTMMLISDSTYGGGSGLEHQNSHVNIVFAGAVAHPLLQGLYAHEVFHAWNVKRLRPADLVPYRYDGEQPTELLWMSEGITDYYADLSLVRGGVIDSSGFLLATSSKIGEVNEAPPVALEDASLSTWIHPVDGTGYIYYPKGSLAGFMLDIMIRDASDNAASLDDVMRRLYRETYGQGGRGFTEEQLWRAVSDAAGGKSFDDFEQRYIDGREPYPWTQVLPLAGLRFVVDTIREPRLGVNSIGSSEGVIVTAVAPGSAAAEAGVQPGDILVSVGDIRVDDQNFGERFRARFQNQEGAPLQIGVLRNGTLVPLGARVRLAERHVGRIELDPTASPRARRIRGGILRGTTGG